MQVHYCKTAPEIVAQTRGKLSAFVMGAGTGGTLAGVSLYLKKHLKNASVKVFLVDPPGSSLSNKVKHGVCYAAQQSERTVKRHRYVKRSCTTQCVTLHKKGHVNSSLLLLVSIVTVKCSAVCHTS
jgi:cysteine synthase